MNRASHLQLYKLLGLTCIPLKHRSKQPLVRWKDWRPTETDFNNWSNKKHINVGVRCGTNLAVLDFDSEDAYRRFTGEHPQLAGCPVVKTGRGFHIWVKPKEPVASCRLDGFEVKCKGSYVVAPPSVHPSGAPYTFVVAPDGALPEVDLLPLIENYDKVEGKSPVPSDFALRYGRSSYPEPLCGLATLVLTRSDGKIKHLISLRCWKWHCPKCAPLLKRYWMEKLSGFPFRFILRLPNEAKPTTSLRRVGKAPYVHILANGESWLFLLGGEAETVWAEAQREGYELVAGDIVGDPTKEEIKECLMRALCREEEPLYTRRKITHSRKLLKRQGEEDEHNESKRQQADCDEGEMDRKRISGEEHLTWASQVVMKPINEVAEELEKEGWHIVWKSEVEALAIKGEALGARDADIVELIESLGVKLKKVGKEYVGLCPFHPDRQPSLSVNRSKGVWHCFGCGMGGTARDFSEAYRSLGLFG